MANTCNQTINNFTLDKVGFTGYHIVIYVYFFICHFS